MVYWTHEITVKLIKLYHEHPLLWDPKNKHYHTKHMRNDAWLVIADSMGCGEEEVKNKMLSLSASYRREKNKVRKTMGKGQNDRYVSRWFAYKHLDFLRNKGTSIDKVNAENNFTDEDSHDPLQDAPQDASDENNVMNNITIPNADHSAHESINPPDQIKEENSEIKTSCSSKKPVAKLKKRKTPSLAHSPYNGFQSITSVSPDECTAFAKYITAKLQKFGEQQKCVLMHKINSVIFEAEMGQFSQEYYTCNASSAASSSSGGTPQNSPFPAHIECHPLVPE